ncbi:hypothetical protein JTB14_015493 [Gonioctena quinquepunctata]|nr:hypothetical protein JTB14_015493 [Gonioctena quinquepunctata]
MISRPDLAFAVSYVSQFMNNYSSQHWTAVKKILRYLQGTKSFGIIYGRCEEFNGIDLCGYTDADYAGDVTTRKSRTGYVFMINGSPVTWCSQRQQVVALSTTEAEYIALSFGGREAVWLRQLLKELDVLGNIPTVIKVDNQSAIKLANNPEFHERTKHGDVKFHYVRAIIENGEVSLNYVESKLQLADIMTKPLPKDKISTMRSELNILDLDEIGRVLDYFIK